MTSPPGQQARLLLNVIIVGGGIGGIAAAVSLGRRGHHVVVLEGAPKLAEVGAGVQISPNMGKLLDRWEVPFHDKEMVLKQIDVRRWQNGKLLSSTKCESVFGKPSTIHRADLHNALLETALSFENVTLRVNSVVTEVDFDTPEVFLADGSHFRGDVVLAADGIKSTIRPKLLQDETIKVAPTGDAAYRLILSREQMLANDLLKDLVNQPLVTRWIGPGRHIVAYPLRNHEQYNVVLAHPDRGTVDDQWTIKGSKQDMIDEFVGWEERVTHILASVDSDEVMVWKLNLYPPLKTWVRGSVALLGDACHPMLPYVAQGAAQAVEDAGALGAILSSLSTRDEIRQALQVYESSRKQHAEQVQQSGGHNQVVLHLPDGPEQESRDELFRQAMQGGSTPDRWTHNDTRTSVWGHDAEEAVLEDWKEFRTTTSR